MADDTKTAIQKIQQDYDPDPPRCETCVYWTYGPQDKYLERQVKDNNGKVRTVRFKKRSHPTRNPRVDRCTFGNFKVSRHGVCNEWHSRKGERIAEEQPNT